MHVVLTQHWKYQLNIWLYLQCDTIVLIRICFQQHQNPWERTTRMCLFYNQVWYKALPKINKAHRNYHFRLMSNVKLKFRLPKSWLMASWSQRSWIIDSSAEDVTDLSALMQCCIWAFLMPPSPSSPLRTLLSWSKSASEGDEEMSFLVGSLKTRKGVFKGFRSLCEISESISFSLNASCKHTSSLPSTQVKVLKFKTPPTAIRISTVLLF